MEKTGFIYIWYDRKHKKYYVGSHLGTEDDGYICSSRWMRQSYKRRPKDFKRRIIQRNLSKEVLKEEEHKWLKQIKNEELGKKYYNLTIALNGNGWERGKSRSEETKKKISETLKGNIPWNKGKTYDEEYKQKVSKGMKLAWEEGRFTKNESHFKEGGTSWNKGNSEHSKNIWKNPDFRKNQIEKKKLMWSTGEFMGNKGKSWFTDGTKNIMLASNDVIPKGFYKGRVFHG